MKKRGHFRVEGRVQGVCYRMYACKEAERLGLTGWVRNCPDGTVEAVAEGEERDLVSFRAWCAKGPPYARVTAVGESYGDASNAFEGFRVRYG